MSSGNVVRRASRFATDPRILHCGSQSSRQVVFLLSLPKSDRSIRAHLQIWDHSISTVSFIKAGSSWASGAIRRARRICF